MTRTLVVVRTRRLDRATLDAHDRLAALDGHEAMIVAEVARGETPIGARRLLVLDRAQLDGLGLYALPQHHRLCGDYALIAARAACRGHEHYWMVDTQAYLHPADLPGFFAGFADLPHDLLAARLAPCDAAWPWLDHLSPRPAVPHGCVLAVARFSGSAIDHLLAMRRRLAAVPGLPAPGQWPEDASFVPTALMAGGFDCADLNVAGVVRHTPDSLPVGAIIDIADLAGRPADGLIHYPTVDFRPWLEQIEARIADYDPAWEIRRGRVAGLRAEAVRFGSVARACLRNPRHAGAALVPLLLAHTLWTERPWAAALPATEPADRQEAGLIGSRLAEGFGPAEGQPAIGTAHTAICLAGADRMTTATPGDFTFGPSFPLGRLPTRVALPFAYDFDRDELMFTLHLSLRALRDKPFLYAAQREAARVVARVGLAALPGIYGPPDPAWSPMLILSLGRTGSTLLERLIGATGLATASEPDVLTGLAGRIDDVLALAPERRMALLHYALAPLRHAICEDPDSRLAIKFRSQVNGLASLIVDAFPKASYVFMVRERRAWARSTFRAFRFPPARVAARLRHGLDALRVLHERQVALTLLDYDTVAADPHGTIARLTGRDAAAEPALAVRVAGVMAADSQADHRVSRQVTAVPLAGEAAWMEGFEDEWAKRRPDGLLRAVGLEDF